MKNFIFKSSDFGLIKNVFNKLDMILAELRHQRQDNVQILYKLDQILVNKKLQKQVDQYFEEDETSHQTDLVQDPHDLD